MAKRNQAQLKVNRRIKNLIREDFEGDFEAGLKRACKGMPGTADEYRDDAQKAWLEAVQER